MKKVIFISLFVLPLLFSCTKEVKIAIPGYEEQLVIDGNIEPDMPPFVLLSTSQDIYSATNLDAYMNSFVSGATVIVSDGITTDTLIEICTDNLPAGTETLVASLFGVDPALLSSYHLCGYTSFNTAIWGQTGRTYELTVIYEGKTYTSSSSILQPVALDSLYWKPDGNLTDYGYSWARLSDPAAEYNAYFWQVKRLNHDSYGQLLDQSYTATYSPAFDDEFFNGLSFDFSYENPTTWNDDNVPDEYKGYYHLNDTVVVKFSRIDKNVYEFLFKKYIQVGTSGNPFATPTNIPTNISGGALGVWAAYSPWYDTLICVP